MRAGSILFFVRDGVGVGCGGAPKILVDISFRFREASGGVLVEVPVRCCCRFLVGSEKVVGSGRIGMEVLV